MPSAPQDPGILNLGFRRGDEYRRIVSVNIDLTGYVLTGKIVSLTNGETKLEFPLTFTTPPHAVGFVLSEAQTLTLQAGDYGFIGEWVAPGSVKRTFLEGVVPVRP